MKLADRMALVLVLGWVLVLAALASVSEQVLELVSGLVSEMVLGLVSELVWGQGSVQGWVLGWERTPCP